MAANGHGLAEQSPSENRSQMADAIPFTGRQVSLLVSCYNDAVRWTVSGEQVMSRRPKTSEVFTLAEAARYLRLPQDTLRKHASRGDIPGRQIGKHWRFLRAALDDWLRRPSSKSVLLEMAGAFKDDPHLDEIVKNAYAERRRTTMK